MSELPMVTRVTRGDTRSVASGEVKALQHRSVAALQRLLEPEGVSL